MQLQRALLLLALLSFAPAADAVATSAPGAGAVALELDAADEKERPVSKVVSILKDMLATMEKEQQEDEEIYNKMACWCETNDREKTKSIAEAEAKIEALTTQIEELTQLSAQLATEIKNTEKEVAANQAALDKATAIRQKELSEFNAEEKDMLQSIAALKGALTVLSKHNSLAQAPMSALQSVAATMKREMDKHALLLEGVLTVPQRKVATGFIQSKYAPQSGDVFGILEEMKTTFDTNLAATQKDEAANLKAYEELKEAKTSEIAAGKEQIAMKTTELANTDENNANAKMDLEDTKKSLSADDRFLMMLKEKCSMTDKEWEERQKTRMEEMETTSKALAILNSDDSQQLFTKTFNAAFLQKKATTHSNAREQAAKLISDVASKNHNPKMSQLAVQVRLDAFTRVKKAIDDMVAMLLLEQEDEVKQKDFCVDGLHENDVEVTQKDRLKEDLLAKIEELKQTIKELTDAIDTLKSEIAELQLQLKRAGEDREKENQEFQKTIADQRETQAVLGSALKVLQSYFGKSAAAEAAKAALIQKAKHGQEPVAPASFSKYEKSKSGNPVMDLIQEIMADAKSMEAETIRSEEDAQKAYEDFTKESNASIEAKTEEMVNKSELKASKEVELVETEKALDNTMLELEQLTNYNAQLHSSCDFVLKNFELRQKARAEEVEALRTAKSILSGAKFQDFLQA